MDKTSAETCTEYGAENVILTEDDEDALSSVLRPIQILSSPVLKNRSVHIKAMSAT